MIVKVTHVFIRVSIVVSISACHADDPGSIPGRGSFLQLISGDPRLLHEFEIRTPTRYIHFNNLLFCPLIIGRDSSVGRASD